MLRKLTAILSADVVGYSSLMEADEEGTLERLQANRSQVFDPQVASHGGRVFKLMGDGALVEFSSVIAAVNCALRIQEATEQSQTELPDVKRIRYRIGINLGEVIVDGDDIYGEGVNVASRLQTIAPVSGVALSVVVRDQVESKTPYVFEDFGEHTLKNIERPVHVFLVRAVGHREADDGETGRLRAPFICVLPFANMSGDTEQEYFSDGITEDIITDLSKVSSLRVVSRNTAFTFKGKRVELPQIARQLKVSHILEGSVRKVGGRVRITAQLVEVPADDHIWAERFDRDLNDIFALQDEISQAIVAALKLKLLPAEKKAIEQRGTTNLEAYNLYLMARQYYVTGNFGDVRRQEAIIRLCHRATEIDANYARAWALMAGVQANLRYHLGRKGDDGLAAAERALTLDASLAEAHVAKARVLIFASQLDEATREIKFALHLDSELYEANLAAGQLQLRQHRLEDAIRYLEKAADLMDSDYVSAGLLVTCYAAIDNMEAARRAAHRTLARTEKIVAQEPDNGSAMGFAVTAFAALGDADRAKEWTKRALLLDPDNLNMRLLFGHAFAQSGDTETALDLLGPLFQKAGAGLLDLLKINVLLDKIRDHPRFKTMMTLAEGRLAAADEKGPPPTP